MKIQVRTNIEPSYKIPIPGKILNHFRHKLPVIEGYEALLNVEYSDLDSKDATPILPIKPVVVEPHGIEGGFDRWAYEPWFDTNQLIMKFHPSISGYIELRVYFRDLKDSDKVIDDYGRNQTFKGDIGSDKAIRYYYKPFRVYSLYEVLIAFFTGIVTIFTILLFVITILLFLIQ